MQWAFLQLRFRKKAVLPVILQEEMTECGHACIAMLSFFWGCKLSLSDLRRLNHTSTRGMTLRQLTHLLDQLGFKTRVLRVSISDLARVSVPAILHWDHNHFVVLKKVQRDCVIVHDPAIGMRTYAHTELADFFAGIVVEAEKLTGAQPIGQHVSYPLWTLLKSVRGMPRVLGALLFLSVILELLQMLNPMLMQYVMDYGVGASALAQMYRIGVGCVIFAGLYGLTEFLRSHLILYGAMQVTKSFATAVFKHLLTLPLAFFYHRHLSDIQAKFQSIEQLKTQLSTNLMHTVLDGLMIIVTLGVMFLYSPILTGIVAVIMSVYGGLLYSNIRTYRQQSGTALALHTKTAVTFFETFRGIIPIKLFLKEDVWFQLWCNEYVDALNHDIQVAQVQIRHRVLNQVLCHVEYIVVVCIGASLILSQRLSVGMLLAFLAYRMLLTNKSTSFVQSVFSYQSLALQLCRLQDVIDYEPEARITPTHPPSQIEGRLCVENIAFTYPGQEKPLFENLSFTVYPGEKIAIVGPSGCGKTTLLKIMMGLEQPIVGKVLLDALPLRLFGIQHFRQLSASVMQDDVLFTGSILDNITFFTDDVDIERVYAVAKLTYIHDLITSFPMGYDTLLGQTQTTISGGQRQRILLARALYKQPKFLFLDEATSHLDLALETLINQALQACSMTQIIVAHRPETIAMANRVLYL